MAMACADTAPILTPDDLSLLRGLGPLPGMPASPTNAVADDPRARRLGQFLFFDTRLSSTGDVSCATCHDPANGFADHEPLAKGAHGRRGRRHAPTIVNAAYSEFHFWDGRADSLWSQPLQAIEGEAEADFSRCETAHAVAAHYREAFEKLFGPFPDLSGVPARARPEDEAWTALSETDRRAVNRIFSNVGKAIEAYVRQIVSRNSRLDRYLSGDESALTEQELRGARVFVREDRGNCVACHSGPNLSDGKFHNTAIVSEEVGPDPGRSEGIARLLEDPFRGSGEFSDAPDAGSAKLDGLQPEASDLGAIKTPTLRDVTRRAPYNHLGSFEDLSQIIRHYDRGGGYEQNPAMVGKRDPLLRAVGFYGTEREDLIAFLHALEGEPLPSDLLGPLPSGR